MELGWPYSINESVGCLMSLQTLYMRWVFLGTKPVPCCGITFHLFTIIWTIPQAMANYFVAAGSNGFWRVSCDGKASFFVSIMKSKLQTVDKHCTSPCQYFAKHHTTLQTIYRYLCCPQATLHGGASIYLEAAYVCERHGRWFRLLPGNSSV